MAQVSRFARATALAALLGLNAAPAFAQVGIPENGLALEGAARWEEALRVYEQLLQAQPARVDVLIRVADIQARLGRANDAAATLARAVELAPTDAPLLARASRAYATANDPMPALALIARALAVSPLEPDYLRAGGQLASWNGDYASAITYYRTLLNVRPNDSDARLQLARTLSWYGDTNESASAYRAYLQLQPATAAAWLELANVESWRGNYAGALDALESYKTRFGESAPEYSVTLARVLAGAGRPSRAVALLDPLYAKDPANYELAQARTMALTMTRRVGPARESLASLRQLDANNKQTQDTARLVRARLGSRIEPGISIYADSDKLQTISITPAGTIVFPSGTELSGGFSRHILEGRANNGLGASDGGSITHEEVWGGLAQSFGAVTLAARAASVRDKQDILTPYSASATFRFGDVFLLSLNRSENFVLISPRTAELALTERRHRAGFEWTPTLKTTIVVDSNYQEFSDGNRRWELRVAPRRAFVRRSRLNLDLGVEAYRMQANRDLANGYYDPTAYEAYQGTAYPYFKLSENVGAGFGFAFGVQREKGKDFEPGGSASAELSIGIYQAWLLRVTGSALHNLRQESGAFRGYTGAVVLVRRF